MHPHAALSGSLITTFEQDRHLQYTWIHNPSPGFDPLDVVGKTDVDLLPAADAAQLESVKRRVLATGQPAREVIQLSVPQGPRSFDLSVAPIFGPGGDVQGIHCLSVDVTEPSHAAGPMDPSDRRFRAIWEISADAMALSDADGIVIDANPAYFQLYGYSPEQVLGHSFALIFPEERRAEAVGQYRQVFADPEIPAHFETTIERADGTRRHVETRISFVHEADRRVAMLSIVEDVTLRKQAEDRLARLQRVMTALGGALSREHVATTILHETLAALGADAGVLALDPRHGAEFEVIAHVGLPPEAPDRRPRFPIQPGGPMADGLRSGQPLLIPNRETLRSRYPEYAGSAADANALAVMPFWHGDHGLGVMLLLFHHERTFSEEDQAVIRALAQQGGLALERARLYEAERDLRRDLETRVEQRTAQLRAEVERRREVQRQLEQSREAARSRIARELHDELGGLLAVLKIDLSRLARKELMAPVSAEFARLAGDVDEIVKAVRHIATELRPAVIDDFGLVAALQQYVEDLHRRTGLAGAFISETPDLGLSPERATACFRICQEALTNVLRHAQATRVDVHVSVRAGHGFVRIRDDGRGMDSTESEPGHLGLVGMRERADLIGATVTIDTSPGEGTTILLDVPL